MSGRTSWWPKDAAWHRRELIVELGEEFGPAGPGVMDVLSAWAQEQRAAGDVRGGFRALAREGFVTIELAQEIVQRAATIGAVDDLERDTDGRRFRCRISGWKADQARGREAIKKADQRAAKTTGDKGGHVPAEGDVSGSVPPTREDLREEEQEEHQAPSAQSARAPETGRALSVECPECGAPKGANCVAARGGTRRSCHLKRHHLVGEHLNKGGGRKSGSEIRSIQKSAAGVAAQDQQLKARADFCAHFPNIPPALVMNARRDLGKPGEPATIEQVRTYFEKAA